MHIGKDFVAEYEQACGDLRRLGPVAESLLRELLAANGLRVHSVTHRIKTQASARRKFEEKEGYSSFDDMLDLLGTRVITFFPDEVDRAAKVVEREFTIDPDNSVDKRALLDPDRFGYLSLHYVASLNAARAALPEHAKFQDLQFEIQIRSILQHAWAEIEHDLGYHTPGSVPNAVRRRFSRLAGLLEIADDEFLGIRKDVEAYQVEVDHQLSADPEDLSINRDSVVAYVRSDESVHTADTAMAKVVKGPVVQPERFEHYAGSLATNLRAAGLESIGEARVELMQKLPVITRFYAAWMEQGKMSGVYQGLSLFYLCYVLVGATGSEERIVMYLKESNISVRGVEGGYKTLARSVLEKYAEASQDASTDDGSDRNNHDLCADDGPEGGGGS